MISGPLPLGATPIRPEDEAQLIPNLATRDQLNEWEFRNILDGQRWAYNSRVLARSNPLNEAYVRKLHSQMFGKTWKWAGTYRRSNLNIGCPFFEIYQRLPQLLANAQYWIDNHVYDVDEAAIRLHQQLVGQIHAFPNGNGRHARLLASVLVVKYERPRLTWGQFNLSADGEKRKVYIDALKALDADDHNVKPLLDFAHS